MSFFLRILLIPVIVAFLFTACHKQQVKEVKNEKKVTKKTVEKVEQKSEEVKTVQKSNLTVDGLTVASDVVDRQPQGAAEVFTVPKGSDFVSIVTWNRILNAGSQTTIKHVYYLNGEKVDEIPLKVAGSSWRTWSRKQIKAEHAGNWKVDVLNDNGDVIASKSFTVNAEE